MVEKMLSERFRLRLHTETRQERIFSMRVAKGGVRVRSVDAPVPPAKEGLVNAAMGNAGGRLIGNKSTMSGLAKVIALFLRQPVIDETGLPGYYDFNLQLNSGESSDENSSGALGSEGVGLFISTLQHELGLSLSGAKGPVKYWVIDHIDMPTPN